MDAHGSPHARGVASYYYGTGSGASSTVGERFADLARREVVARTGMLDLGGDPQNLGLRRWARVARLRLHRGYPAPPVGRPLLPRQRPRGHVALPRLARLPA